MLVAMVLVFLMTEVEEFVGALTGGSMCEE